MSETRELDDVERCRRVRRQLESEFPTLDLLWKYLAKRKVRKKRTTKPDSRRSKSKDSQ